MVVVISTSMMILGMSAVAQASGLARGWAFLGLELSAAADDMPISQVRKKSTDKCDRRFR